jgi:hypothetical protein
MLLFETTAQEYSTTGRVLTNAIEAVKHGEWDDGFGWASGGTSSKPKTRWFMSANREYSKSSSG